MNYYKYIKSKKWKEFREKILIERGYKCEKCGVKKSLQIHHLSYQNLFQELSSDVMVLCSTCHKKEHGIYDLKNGKLVLTEKIIDSLKTKKGGFSKTTLKSLNVEYPLKKGWKNKLIGMKVDKRQFLKLKIEIQNNQNQY